MNKTIEALCSGQHLSRDEVRAVFDRVIAGAADAVQLGAFLVALKAKGETAEEIAGAAEALLDAARPFDRQGLEVADSCGTGGDGLGTVNISTAVAIVAAQMGLHLAKHGNRSISSKCGSADVLEACGVAIDAPSALATSCLQRHRICFLLAPQYHPGVRHAMAVRTALGVRTIFNMVGPLCNPARPAFQLMGIYDPKMCKAVAETLGLLGCRRALVVNGGGLDEIALHAPTAAALLSAGEVRLLTIDPEDAGLGRRGVDELRGGDARSNALWLRALLAGQGSPAHNEAVAINVGALLWVAERAKDLKDGTEAALDALARGEAVRRLDRWAHSSQGVGATAPRDTLE